VTGRGGGRAEYRRRTSEYVDNNARAQAQAQAQAQAMAQALSISRPSKSKKNFSACRFYQPIQLCPGYVLQLVNFGRAAPLPIMMEEAQQPQCVPLVARSQSVPATNDSVSRLGQTGVALGGPSSALKSGFVPPSSLRTQEEVRGKNATLWSQPLGLL